MSAGRGNNNNAPNPAPQQQSDKIEIGKFSGNAEDYLEWKTTFRSFARLKGISKPLTEDQPADQNQRANWKDQNEKLYDWLIMSLDRETKSTVVMRLEADLKPDNGRAAWQIVESLFTGTSALQAATLEQELLALKYEESRDMEQYLKRATYLANQINHLKPNSFTPDQIKQRILLGLPESFKWYVHWKTQQQPSPSLGAVQQELIEMALTDAASKKQRGSVSSGDATFNVNHRDHQNHNSGKPACTNCGRSNHNTNACYRACGNCGQSNHRAAECKAKCYTCGKPNHNVSSCNVAQRKYAPRQQDASHLIGTNESFGIEGSFAIIDQTDSTIKINNNSKWMLDSGTTAHICNQRNLFFDIKPSPIASIQAANGTTMTVNGIGDIKLDINTSNVEKQVTLKDVLLVPDAIFNLVSIRALVDNGYNTSFYRNYAKIHRANNDSILLNAERLGKYFVITSITTNQSPIEAYNMVNENNGINNATTSVTIGFIDNNDSTTTNIAINNQNGSTANDVNINNTNNSVNNQCNIINGIDLREGVKAINDNANQACQSHHGSTINSTHSNFLLNSTTEQTQLPTIFSDLNKPVTTSG